PAARRWTPDHAEEGRGMRRRAPGIVVSSMRVYAIALAAVALLPSGVQARQNEAPGREQAVRVEGAEDEPNLVVRYRERYEALRDHGFSLMVGSITPGASLSAGAGLARERLFGTPLGV